MKTTFSVVLVLLALGCNSQALPELIPFRSGDKWGYCDSTKKVVIPAKYGAAEPFQYGFALVYDQSKREHVLINANTHQVHPTIYPILNRQEDGDFIIQSKDNKMGLMSRNLEVLVEPNYYGISSIQEKFIDLSDDNGSGIYDIQSKQWALKPQKKYEMIEHVLGPVYGLSEDGMGFSKLFNAEMKKDIVTGITMAYAMNDQFILVVYSDGGNAVINKKGDILIRMAHHLSYQADNNRIGFIGDNEHYGFIDYEGKEVISSQFEMAFPFKKERAVVSKNDKFGVIDTEGNWIVPNEYEVLNYWFNEFKGPVLPLNKGDSTYFFDVNGTIINVIPKINTYVGFENEIMPVFDEKKLFAFVNEKGEFITEFKYSGPGKFKNGICQVSLTNPDKTLYIYYIDKYGNEYILE